MVNQTVPKGGAYLMRFTPDQPNAGVAHYDGTLRVEKRGAQILASGDLYFRRRGPGREPDPAQGIPIFPRRAYSTYLSVKEVVPNPPDSFRLSFEPYVFDASHERWVAHNNPGRRNVDLVRSAAPAGYAAPADFFTGIVRHASGARIGAMSLGWVSSSLRRGTLELDRVQTVGFPAGNAQGLGWRQAFAEVGWDLTVIHSDTDVEEPGDGNGSWSDAELHAAMLARRDAMDLDQEWRFHVLCVTHLEDPTILGITFDQRGGDSQNLFREVVGLAAGFTFEQQPLWHPFQGQNLDQTPAYFRTAVHESGHAMNLEHNTRDHGFMCPTIDIASNAGPHSDFGRSIVWHFHPDDQHFLRHAPDIVVRPGTLIDLKFDSSIGAAVRADWVRPQVLSHLNGLEVQVTPLFSGPVPLGAPVRFEMKLVNRGTLPQTVPPSLGLKFGHVTGRVIDPSGTIRTFRPLLTYVSARGLRRLEPNAALTDSLSLLRGAEGVLFPVSGRYQVVVEVAWRLTDQSVVLAGETSVEISPAVDKTHQDLAEDIFSNRELLLNMALGGDHLKAGYAVLFQAMRHPVLGPHYVYLEAKRLARPFFKRPRAAIEEICHLIAPGTVLSNGEIKRIAQWIQSAAAGPNDTVARAARLLKQLLAKREADSDLISLVQQACERAKS